MDGELVEVSRGSGEGYVSFDSQYSNTPLGSSPGSLRRTFLSLFIPRPDEGVCTSSILSIGVRQPEARIPFRWKVAIDGSTIAREFKPQFRASIDKGVYMRAIYDVKPLLSRKLAERVSHRFTAVYDSYQPVTLADVSLLAVFSGQGRYSYSYHTGALAMEPGDSVKVDASIGGLIGDRVAVIALHIPSTSSIVRIVAGGSDPVEVTGPGFRLVRVKIPYRGGLVPVAIMYEDPGTRFYPRIVTVSDVLVYDQVYPSPRLRLRIDSVEASDSEAVIEGVVENTGEGPARSPMIIVLGMGIRLARSELGDVEPGSSRRFTVRARLDRAPIRPSSLTVRVVWSNLGRTMFDDAHVRV
ncbi:MAG: hypothetical protein GSR86_05895 [Desulfurococcales archaeon]|nr:hypothetical protein [Desulfurococcales archaeon]